MVLAVNGYNEPRATIEKYVKQNNLQQKVLLMGRDVAREKYIVTGFPTDYFIDRTGKIIDRQVGFAADFAEKREEELRKLIEKHGKKKEAGD